MLTTYMDGWRLFLIPPLHFAMGDNNKGDLLKNVKFTHIFSKTKKHKCVQDAIELVKYKLWNRGLVSSCPR